MKNNIIKFFISIIICQLAGIIGSFFTAPAVSSSWLIELRKTSFFPPNWLFAPAWIILYFLMGVSLFLVWKKNWGITVTSGEQEKQFWNPVSKKLWTGSWREENAVLIFSLQLVLNTLWSIIFFGLKLPGLAFFEILMLWFSIIYLIANFYRISKTSAYLLLPYILWVSFAAFLNFSVWQLNW